MPKHRRSFLAAAGVTLGSLAGCLRLGGDETTTTTTQPPGGTTTTQPPGETTTSTTTTQPKHPGKWPQFQNDAGRTGYSPSTVGESANRAWRTSIDGTVERSPVVGEDAVYVTASGTVYSLDRATGKQRWQAGGATGPPVVHGSQVLFSSGAAIEVVDAASGKRQRRISLPARAVTGPVVAGSDLYVGCTDERVHAYTLDGKHQWQTVPLNTSQFEPLAVGDKRVFVASNLGLYAHDRAGGFRDWSATRNSVTDAPTVADGSVFFPTSGEFVARYSVDGKEQWRTPVSGLPRGSVAVGGGSVYAVAGNASLYRLNASGGGVVWRSRVPTATDSSPALADNAVAVNDSGSVHTFVTEQGGTLWSADVTGVDDTSCAIVDGTVFAGGTGVVAAFAPE
ncbi:PQQ-binding-like beta-propeller repeat protein [Halospeciosus flavus]|uniref:PQQ-binding-like beta-propeller repeat protein n=1 Tax=Halospeciosus flavus TaxID=3032283 RepID=A0ABD5Z4C8_9EURY|nr:PQQ-binding-like beta-propeller repeat protein [Halospeciosus flavus]